MKQKYLRGAGIEPGPLAQQATAPTIPPQPVGLVTNSSHFQGASFLLTDENGEVSSEFMSYLPLMGMTLFFFSLGFNWVVTLTLLGEIFSPSIKGMATSIATVIWYTLYCRQCICIDPERASVVMGSIPVTLRGTVPHELAF